MLASPSKGNFCKPHKPADYHPMANIEDAYHAVLWIHWHGWPLQWDVRFIPIQWAITIQNTCAICFFASKISRADRMTLFKESSLFIKWMRKKEMSSEERAEKKCSGLLLQTLKDSCHAATKLSVVSPPEWFVKNCSVSSYSRSTTYCRLFVVDFLQHTDADCTFYRLFSERYSERRQMIIL